MNWELMNKRYGDRWGYFMPPQGTPVSFIENSSALNTFAPALEAQMILFKTTPIQATTGEILVITRYSLRASVAIVNPFWPGRLPTPLPDTAFQGRFAWTVMTADSNGNDRSLIGNVTYQNTDIFPAGHIQTGKSLLKDYGTGSGDPPIIILPNTAAYLAIYALPTNRGAEPPPVDSPQVVLTAELSGYRLPIPVSDFWIGPHANPAAMQGEGRDGRRVSAPELPGRRGA